MNNPRKAPPPKKIDSHAGRDISDSAQLSTGDVAGRQWNFQNQWSLENQRSLQKWSSLRWKLRVGVLVFTVGWLSMFGCNHMFYHPDQLVYFNPAELGLVHEDVFFTAKDETRLHGWFVQSQTQPVKGTVIHFHGNAANITNHIASVEWLPWEGYQVLLFDYRGYGRSEGKVTRKGTVMDGHAAVDYALSRSDVDPNSLFIYGQSLGGAVGAYVGSSRPEVRAMVIESSFASYRGIAARHALNFAFFDSVAKPLAWWLISGDHDPIDVIAEFSPRPLLVIVCSDDPICPPDLGKELFDAAQKPKEFLIVQGAAHYEAVQDGGEPIKRAIVQTFERALTTP